MCTMKAVRTVEEKKEQLRERQNKQKNIGKQIDRMIAAGQQAEAGESIGCGGGDVCSMIGRGLAKLVGITRRSTAVSTKEIEAVSISPSETKSKGSEISRAVLGMGPSKKRNPASKLEAAKEAMRKRVDDLEARFAESKNAARAQMQAGNKTAALRELRRGKALEKQAVSTRNVMDAVEAQSDMLEQTALQKQVAAALGETAKTMKKEKELLNKAEDAVDAASEMRDLHEDLAQVMSGLGDSSSMELDDDELLNELNDIIAAPPYTEKQARPSTLPVPPPMNDDLEDNETYNTLEVLRQMPAAAKGRIVNEKQLLLQSQ